MAYMKMTYQNVDFTLGRDGQKLNIDYTQYNFVDQPDRIALIDTALHGIPFEGYDSYLDGVGGMKGTLAKNITLFNQTGKDMDGACLATYLSESLFVPNALLQGRIAFEEIDGYHVKATISYNGIQAQGVFTFNESYEMVEFATNDRAVVGTDGSIEYVPWSVVCDGYQKNADGILHPTTFQAIWHYSDGDFIYFDSRNTCKITYDKK
jgi:hypothetical protein